MAYDPPIASPFPTSKHLKKDAAKLKKRDRQRPSADGLHGPIMGKKLSAP